MLKSSIGHVCLRWTLTISHIFWDLELSHWIGNCGSWTLSFQKLKINLDSSMYPFLLAKGLYLSYLVIVWCQNYMISIALPDTITPPTSFLRNMSYGRIRIGARDPQPTTLGQSHKNFYVQTQPESLAHPTQLLKRTFSLHSWSPSSPQNPYWRHINFKAQTLTYFHSHLVKKQLIWIPFPKWNCQWSV